MVFSCAEGYVPLAWEQTGQSFATFRSSAKARVASTSGCIATGIGYGPCVGCDAITYSMSVARAASKSRRTSGARRALIIVTPNS